MRQELEQRYGKLSDDEMAEIGTHYLSNVDGAVANFGWPGDPDILAGLFRSLNLGRAGWPELTDKFDALEARLNTKLDSF
jgi:hypothetical protein